MSKKEKEDKGKKKPEKITLLEGTAFANIDQKEGNDTTAVWVKTSQLDYEKELKKLQIELMKLHLNGIARRNQAEHLSLSLDSVIEELGLTELK